MAEKKSDIWRQYDRAQRQFKARLKKSNLTPEQLICLNQLPGAIVDGASPEISRESASREIGNIVRACHGLGVPRPILGDTVRFGARWKRQIYPRGPQSRKFFTSDEG